MRGIARRRFLKAAGAFAVAGGTLGRVGRAFAQEDPILTGRPLVRYPEKTDLILLTSRPPQLETPMKYFEHAITPNDAFFVRYHINPIPTSVDLATWRLKVAGVVDHPLELSMEDLKTKFPKVTLTAVTQCSGNSRGRSAPRVYGGQWGDGAMGCAEWAGPRLKDILAMAGVRPGAVEASFNGLDHPIFPATPDFVKSLTIDRIMNDPDILVAYEMNGQPLPMLNGYPVRLIVPGWYATYWVKNLFEISVLDKPFEGFWMKTAYRIPDDPCGCVEPSTAPKATVPINYMTTRSFIIVPEDGARLPMGSTTAVKGIAFDGGSGIREVEISEDAGVTWRRTQLGPDLGRYAFREWSTPWQPARAGTYRLMVRAFNTLGQSQDYEPRWNPAGFLRNVIEHVDVHVG